MNNHKLPRTDSIQELANFWDTHDLTDFAGDLENVTEPVFERDSDITVRLETDDAQAVREIARLRGIGESELVREWVVERIHAT